MAVVLSAHTGESLSSFEGRQPEEAEVKAEYVERFTRFIEWPDKGESGAEAPFIIGVIGSTPVAHHLEHVARGRQIKGRDARVLRIRALDSVQRCDLVFIAGGEEVRLNEILARTSGRPILTVADTAGFGERGVLINLYRDGEYIRFEINRDAVQRSRLRFDVHLLKVARLIGADDEQTSSAEAPAGPSADSAEAPSDRQVPRPTTEPGEPDRAPTRSPTVPAATPSPRARSSG
jgi:hypothetical protein